MKYSTLNDSQIWNSFLSGDNQALSLIYKKYYKLLFAYGIKIISDSELVKDCIQDLFVKLHLNRKQLSPTPYLHSYLLLAFKRKLYDISSSVNEFEELPFDLVSDEIIAGDFFHINDEDLKKREKLEKSLSTLSPRQREILYLRFVNDLSLEEISQILNVNYQSVKNLIYRIIVKLRLYYFSSPD